MRDFKRNGLDLPEAERKRIAEIQVPRAPARRPECA
jgi:hypothetical protein